MQIKALIVFSLLTSLVCTTNDTSAQSLDKVSLIGGTLDYNVRKGTVYLDDDHTEDIGKPSLVTGGFVLGKRWQLLQGLRLQISADIKYGTVVDDTLPASYFNSLNVSMYTPTIIYTTFLYGGCVADFQVPFAITSSGGWYVHAGGGGHIVDMNESERTLDNPPEIVEYDNYPVSQLALSASVQGGLGFEIALSPRYGFALEYSLRYWYPVHYEMSRDLFPVDPMHYHEQFFSHELAVMLLVKRR